MEFGILLRRVRRKDDPLIEAVGAVSPYRLYSSALAVGILLGFLVLVFLGVLSMGGTFSWVL